MPENPLDRVAALARLLESKAHEIGMEMQSFIPMVNTDDDGGKHFIQVMFVVDNPATATQAITELSDTDAQFAGILQATAEAEKEAIAAQRRQEDQDKADRAREKMLELKDRLDRGQSLFD